jgi:hypothetical protein
MLYDNFDDLLFDMYLSKSEDILSADEPKHLIMGWVSLTKNHYWQIRLQSVRELYKIIGHSENKYNKLTIEMFQSNKSRAEINKFLNKYYPYFIEKRPELPKYMKLRAFL